MKNPEPVSSTPITIALGPAESFTAKDVRQFLDQAVTIDGIGDNPTVHCVQSPRDQYTLSVSSVDVQPPTPADA